MSFSVTQQPHLSLVAPRPRFEELPAGPTLTAFAHATESFLQTSWMDLAQRHTCSQTEATRLARWPIQLT